MKALMAILLLALCTVQAGAGEHVVLYARLLQDLNVELTDGSTWQMD